ncbi:TonB-dependent receptor [candidate division KSB1 bacterium]|nr:TonB-dependent receptor [candidate division KSB1 bacterium]
MKRIQKTITTIIILLVVLLLIGGSHAQSLQSGRIKGTVVDSDNNNPLPGVNVIVKGTYKGAATGLDGSYFISGLSPGYYDIEVSMIGYTVQLKTGVYVGLHDLVTIDFKLTPTTLALGQEVVIIGEKPIIEVDVTASQQRISSEEIANKIVEDVDDIVADQMGVVKTDNEIHIRGGRADENLYIINGLSVKDPLSGYGKGLYVSADAIKELNIITGGFNAEYGQAMSGIVDVVTKEGGDKYSGSLSVKSDNWGIHEITHYNTDGLEFTFGGAEPLTSMLLPRLGLNLPGDFYFFINGYGHLTDTYLPSATKLAPYNSRYQDFAQREENDWHGLFKLTWKLNPNQKLSISYDGSLNINQGYFLSRAESNEYFPYEYSKMLDNYNTMTQESSLMNVVLLHTLNTRTFYELNIGRFFTSLISAVQGKKWSEYIESKDMAPIFYYPGTDGNINIYYGDGFYDTGDAPNWYNYYSDNWKLKFTLTSQVHAKHQIKTGYDATYTEMQVIDINAPWYGESGLGRNHDFYRVYPNEGAFFVQDKIVYDGMIVNIGLRYDYWFAGKYVQDAIDDPETVTITDAARKKFKDETFTLFGYRGKGHLSPRLGISHPVTDQDVLYFNYGHFSQRPKGQYVYAKLNTHSEATYQLFGNPNLNPTTTVAYELGIKHKFSDKQAIELKAYYKDMFDYPTSQRITKFNPRLGEISYYMYINMDYARSRGIEVRFQQRYSKYLSGNMNFTYAIATGKSSTPNDNLLVEAGKLDEKPLSESFLRWDKPFLFFANIYFKVDKGTNLKLWKFKIPDQWGITARLDWESGKRYTRKLIINEQTDDRGQPYYNTITEYDNPYQGISDPWWTLDLKLHKLLHFWGLNYTFFLEIENVFNKKIPRVINPVTGKAYAPGDIITESETSVRYAPRSQDPSNYNWPRTVVAGIHLNF